MERVSERRKYQRFNVKPGVLAVFGPASEKMGQIIDISQGGLSFNYKEGPGMADGSYELSILFDDNSNLNHRPCKFSASIVSDIKIENEKQYSAAVIRRCGLQFGALTYYQKTWLDDCMRNYTAQSP